VRTRPVRVSSGLERSALALMFGRCNFQHHVTSRLATANSDTAGKAGRWCGCLACGGVGALMHPDPCRQSPNRPDGPHDIKHDENALIMQREGSHATPSASATPAATSLSGRVDISV
jgi:hypothetical protein